MEEKEKKVLAPEFGEEEEQDLLFRLQMRVYDWLMRNWKHLLVVAGVFLLVVLIYGLWEVHHRDSQRQAQYRIAKVLKDMPLPDPMYYYGLGPMDDPNDASRMETLRKKALELDKVSEQIAGTAVVFALLEAADAYQRAGEKNASIASLEKAHILKEEGLLGWAVASSLASAYAAQGDYQKGTEIYRQFADSGTGFFSAQALYNLAVLHADGGDKASSRLVMSELMTRYPDSGLQEEATAFLQGLGEG